MTALTDGATERPIACAHCGGQFKPRRRSARFCGDTCRKRASRGAPTAPKKGANAFLSVTGLRGIPQTTKPVFVTLRPPKALPNPIVPDGQWPGMYRLSLPQGSLSDMVNLTRAKDALLS
jgi:hypothetical protein